MGRLTQKDEQGNWILRGDPWESLHEGQVITKELWKRLYGALWKLMEYEDIGLTPEEIERLKEQHRWIPVKERLPEKDDFVLVTVSGTYNHLTFSDALQLASYTEDDGWFIESYPEWDDPNVIAWMPLPEPYQWEKNNE